MENGKLDPNSDVPPRMNETLQQAAEYMRALPARFVLFVAYSPIGKMTRFPGWDALYSSFGSSVLAPGKQRSREFARVYPVTAVSTSGTNLGSSSHKWSSFCPTDIYRNILCTRFHTRRLVLGTGHLRARLLYLHSTHARHWFYALCWILGRFVQLRTV